MSSNIVEHIRFMLNDFVKNRTLDYKYWHDYINEYDVQLMLNLLGERETEIERLKKIIEELLEELPSYEPCERCSGFGNDGHFWNGMHISYRCSKCNGEGFLEVAKE